VNVESSELEEQPDAKIRNAITYMYAFIIF